MSPNSKLVVEAVGEPWKVSVELALPPGNLIVLKSQTIPHPHLCTNCSRWLLFSCIQRYEVAKCYYFSRT